MAAIHETLHQLRTVRPAETDARGRHIVSLDIVMSDEFMRANTPFPTFSAMVSASGLRIDSQEDFDRLAENPAWNRFVADKTRFEGWDRMKHEAAKHYVKGQLGLA